MLSLKVVFTPGRSGTAFLAQVFGFGDYAKRAVYLSDGILVSHEHLPSKDIPVPFMKEHGVDSASGLAHGASFLRGYLQNLGREYPRARGYLTTDHRIGRFFAWALHHADIDYQVVFLRRDVEDVARSFQCRLDKERDRLDADTFRRYQHNNWTKSFYHPTDRSAIRRVAPAAWDGVDSLGRFLWYAEEVEAQAEALRKLLPGERFIEIDYEQMKGGDLDRLAEFLGMPYATEGIDVVVNKDDV